MPELPEVETVRRSLNRLLPGKTVAAVRVYHPPMVRVTEEVLNAALCDKTVERIERRGKYLIFSLSDVRLLVHLRMEGKFFLRDTDHHKTKHEHWMIRFSDHTALWYHDVRKFGTVDLRYAASYLTIPPLSNLGLEPDDAALDPEYLHRRMASERPVKAVLLDQTVIAGIGNIYADEILFCAGVDPAKKAKSLSRKTCGKIIDCSVRIFKEAVALGGASVRTYTDTLGIHGRFQTRLNVHLRAAKPCTICRQPIEKTFVVGRGTYRCRHCQN